MSKITTDFINEMKKQLPNKSYSDLESIAIAFGELGEIPCPELYDFCLDLLIKKLAGKA